MARVAVIGAGYVGLTTAACMASLGHDVTCVEIDEVKVDRLSRGDIPIYEEGLGELVADGLGAQTLRFTTEFGAVSDREMVFLCVPTPQREDGSADLSYVEAAARAIAPELRHDAIVINKSTVPVGSTHVVEQAIHRTDAQVVSNPEFLREGSAVPDFLAPDRIVIGADDQDVAIRVGALYARLAAPVIVTDPASAELIKYASNAFLASKISFVNAIAAVSEAVGADVNDVVLGMGYDSRIGSQFLQPGPGWGGSCFPKDTRALIRIAADAGYDFGLLEGVVEVNEAQLDRVTDKVAEIVQGDLDGKLIAAWGLTFKARTDDLRDSPALEIIRRIIARGGSVRAFDPAIESGSDLMDGLTVVGDPYEACSGAEALVVLTEWEQFRWLDLDKVGEKMACKRVVDSRNLLDRAALHRRSFVYRAIGRSDR